MEPIIITISLTNKPLVGKGYLDRSTSAPSRAASALSATAPGRAFVVTLAPPLIVVSVLLGIASAGEEASGLSFDGRHEQSDDTGVAKDRSDVKPEVVVLGVCKNKIEDTGYYHRHEFQIRRARKSSIALWPWRSPEKKRYDV